MVSLIRTDRGRPVRPLTLTLFPRAERGLSHSTALLLAFGLMGSAFAASPEVDARAAAEDARQAFANGDFPRAIARFEDARRLKPAPGLLFNLGQSHRRAGHLALAVSFFRRYLETNPAPAQAAVASALLRELAPSGLVPPPLPPLEGEPLWLPSTPTEFTLHPSPAPPLVTRWWFWTLVGAAAAGGAVALGVSLAPHPAPTSLSPIDAR